MTWATRWQRIRQTFADVADVIAIGRAVEAGYLTPEEASAAINRIGTAVQDRRTADPVVDTEDFPSAQRQLAHT